MSGSRIHPVFHGLILPDCSEKCGSPLALMSWSVTNLIFLLLSWFSRLLLSILISLASLLWNPGVYMYAIKELISPPTHWSSLIQINLLCPNYISSVIFKALLSAVLSIAYTASPASLCPLILFFCQNAQSNMDFKVWGFFSLQSKAILQEPLQHLRSDFPCGPAAQCDQGQLELHSLQAAFDFLPSIENAEAGFAQLASFILGRAGIALGAPETQISWPFSWSLCDAFEIMLGVSDSSVGILWCRETWNRIIWLCETAKLCLVIFGALETLEYSDPL